MDGSMEKDEMRKGPWTEQEDAQLVLYVNLFGDRRWDFIAKVSGLRRTGKSCRLRWVNYLHPGLKKHKITPHEERLVLQLHHKWGNRWSKIAQKLPGRTDNEIKNYWRAHARKKAQERKTCISPPLPAWSSSSILTKEDMPKNPITTLKALPETGDNSFYNTGGTTGWVPSPGGNNTLLEVGENMDEYYSMDEIWKDIELSEQGINCATNTHTMAVLPPGDLGPIECSLWSTVDEEEIGQHDDNY